MIRFNVASRKVISAFVLSFFQYPVDDGWGYKKSQNNLSGIDVDEQCGQDAYQDYDE